MTVGMLLSGGWIGSVGVRAAFRLILGVFMCASVAASLLPPGAFIFMAAARAVQGVAAGAAQALAMMTVMAVFPLRERGRAMAVYGYGIILSPIAGPFIGGILNSWLGWQSVFLFALPLCAMAWWQGARRLPRSAPPDLPRSVSVLASLLLCGFVVGLTGAFLMGARQPGVAAAYAAIGFVSLAWLVHDQSRTAQQMLDFALLRRPAVLAANVLALCYGVGLYGSTYLLPVYLQELGGRASWQAGIAMLPGGIALMFTLHAGGWLADRFPVRPALVGALAVFMASNAVFLAAPVPVSITFFVIATTVGRGATGLLIPLLNAGATRIAESHTATLAVMVNYFRTLGGVMGVGLVGLLLQRGSVDSGGASASQYANGFMALVCSLLPAIVAVGWLRARD
jgi:predicted MFS family arabinose efflux permease